MKKVFLGYFLLGLVGAVFATVVELEDATAKNVLQVYEEMREEEEEIEPENQWIHDFESESLGDEMDHLSKLKATEPQKKIRRSR